MEQRGETVVETLEGVGEVSCDEAPFCYVKYRITVFQGWKAAGSERHRQKRIAASVEPIDKPMFELCDAKNLRLELQDGRRLYFSMRNTNGDIDNRDGKLGLHYPAARAVVPDLDFYA